MLRSAVLLSGLFLAACASAPTPDQTQSRLPLWLDGTGRAALSVVVERGQSLESIAQTYRVAKRDIIATNHLAAPYNLKPGTLLEVPLDKRFFKKAPTWSSNVTVAVVKTPAQSKMAKASAAARHAKIKRRETTVTSLHRPKTQEPSPQ